jgi:hypothetical protein
MRAKPLTLMRRGRLPPCSCRHHHVDGLHRQSGRNATPSGITPSTIMSPIQPQHPGSRTEIRLGARAHTTDPTTRAHPPPNPSYYIHPPQTPHLTAGPC